MAQVTDALKLCTLHDNKNRHESNNWKIKRRRLVENQ